MSIKDKHEHPINVPPRLLSKNNFIIYFLMPHDAKCDVISQQYKKFKLKYLINKTLQRKSTKELVLQF